MRITIKPLLTLCVTLLAGCKVGPNYEKPEVTTPTHFQEAEPHKMETISDEALAHWWTTFQDPFLESLIKTALEQNYDYKIALENIQQARSQYRIDLAQLLPELDASASGSRFRESRTFRSSKQMASTTTTVITPVSTTTSSTTATLPTARPYNNVFQVGLDVLWEADLFGRIQRTKDASYDIWEATIEEVRAVKIALISEVANTYATICSLQEQKAIAEETLLLDEELLILALEKFEAGLTPEQPVENQIALLEGDAAILTQVQAALKSAVYSMATLLGKLPEEVNLDFEIIRPIPKSIDKVPAGLPSDLLRRRPDIKSAERQLAAATEQIGVAVAALFPTLTLTGSNVTNAVNPLGGANVGYTSDRLRKLFKTDSRIWGIGGLVEAPIFDFGKRMSNVDIQKAIRNQALYTYQQTVLAAFQETETVLTTYFNEVKREKSLEKQVEANNRNLTLAKNLYEAGLTDYSQVLAAQEVWLSSMTTLTTSRQAVAADLIAVYKALGGDWQ